MVSINVPSMAMVPWRTGSVVLAVAWAMGALPRPASLEKMPRWKPFKTTRPKPPPAAALPVKALAKMLPKAPGTALAWERRMIKQAST